MIQILAKLATTLREEPFQKWELNFTKLVKPISRLLGNRYIMVAIDYATKWVEVRTLHINIVAITAQFLYKHILIRFGCPLTIVTDQDTHFINDVIKYLTNHFILRQTNSTVYYP